MNYKSPSIGHRFLSLFLASKLLKRARQFRQTQPQMAVFAHDFIGIEISVYGRYENQELAALSKLIKDLDRSRSVLDVGANIGNHSLYFIEEGFNKIHAFEPNARTSHLLQFNTDQFAQIQVHNYGLSNQDAQLEAAIPLTNMGGASLQAIHGDEVERVTFEVKKFDNLKIASEPIGIIKIDVEGHEPEVIEGIRATLERDKPLVLFECNRKSEKTVADEVLAQLRSIGYDRFSAIEPLESIIPQTLPSLVRRPLRILEMFASARRSKCQIVPLTEFKSRNYPMIVASCLTDTETITGH